MSTKFPSELPTETSPPPNQSPLEKKRDRIDAYMQQSLDEPALRRRMLGIAASDAMDIAVVLKAIIDKNLTADMDAAQDFETVAPMIELCLKAGRQTAQYLQVEQRIVSATPISKPDFTDPAIREIVESENSSV